MKIADYTALILRVKQNGEKDLYTQFPHHSVTVWKFNYFSVIQILREINFGES